MTDTWPPNDIELLTRRWGEGMSATLIAEELNQRRHRVGLYSRNSVLGKAHRLGLDKRPSPIIKAGEKAPYSKRHNHVRLTKAKALPKPVKLNPAHECRWITTSDRPWVFCGQPCVQGYSYCPEHKDRAYLARAAE